MDVDSDAGLKENVKVRRRVQKRSALVVPLMLVSTQPVPRPKRLSSAASRAKIVAVLSDSEDEQVASNDKASAPVPTKHRRVVADSDDYEENEGMEDDLKTGMDDESTVESAVDPPSRKRSPPFEECPRDTAVARPLKRFRSSGVFIGVEVPLISPRQRRLLRLPKK